MAEKIAPLIRFDAFTNNWKQRELGSIVERVTRKNQDLVSTLPLTISAQYGLIDQNEFFDKRIASKDVSGYYLIFNGDFAYNKSTSNDAPWGAIKRLDRYENGVLSTLYIVFKIFDETKINSDFLVSYYSTELWHKGIQEIATEGARNHGLLNIAPVNFFETKLFLPQDIEEQCEIGAYFKNLDCLIALNQDRCDKVVGVRATMLEKLFVQGTDSVPQIRFGEYTKSWKKVRLGGIVVPYSDLVETPHDGYERLGIRSHGKGVFHDYVEAGKELGTAQMHRVAAHNLIVNITFAWEHAVAITCEDDEGKLVSHRFPQFSMTDEVYDQFLKYLILDSKFRHHLLLSSPGGAGRNRVLKVPEMLEYEMMIPDIEEQRGIAGYLNSLDELIELYKVRVEKLKNIKAAFLQKMFV